ncbi:ERF family protein [Mammaliicoccus sciuri]|uniref:ERF family protein n=1 Tax=Mammaliicoccus sciuri TaxID=1296 RepID=UPI0021D27615|nr:ERF family protein [Mammaliicoccus sciuri]UXV29994.1 ERF family protein [Mammaliicoccus sciuri]
MTEKLNLFQKIADVKANIDGFTKDTKGYNYKYVSGSQILHKIRNKMIENNLLLVPKTSEENYQQVQVTRFNQKAKREVTTSEFVVEMKLTYVWINADNPEERLEVPFYSVGQQDDVSKAHGTGLTYAERYFLMKFFNIPTDEDDADAKQKRENYAPKAKPEQIKNLQDKIKQAVEVGGEDATEQKVMQWLKISDYDAVTEVQINPMIKRLNDLISSKRGGQ